MDWTPEQRALLDTIAGTESPGYNVMYGGKRFSDYSAHPNVAIPITSGPNAGRTSSAAGRYQFINSTYAAQAKKLGLTDFSPQSQDMAAWDLAATTYKQKTGQDLQSALASGDANTIAGVGKALSGQWTSLPGGIEAAAGGSNRFVTAFNKAAGNPSAPGGADLGTPGSPNTGGAVASKRKPAPGQPGGDMEMSEDGTQVVYVPVEDQRPKGLIPKMVAAFGGDPSPMQGGIFGMLNKGGIFNRMG